MNAPIPYLLTGGNTQAQEQFVRPTVTNNNWNELSFIQGSASHDLMQLQGGPLTFSIGAADVYRNLSAPNPGAGQDGTVGIIGATTYSVGSQNNASVYAELLAPVTKNLELDAAIRYDYYNTPNNSTWNPKIGAKWTPTQWLALRGTAGTGFRAPFITEAGNSGTTFNLGNIRDPLNCPASNANGSPNLNSPLNVQGTCVFPPAFLQSANKDLQPEKSDNFTAGFILEPIKGWSTTFDYYYIKLKNQIIPAVSASDYDPIPNIVRNPSAAARDLWRRPHRPFPRAPRCLCRRPLRQRSAGEDRRLRLGDQLHVAAARCEQIPDRVYAGPTSSAMT